MLFILDDEDKDFEDPTVIQVRVNLVMAERVQQQQVEQRRLKRAQHQVEAEVEKLWREVKEAESVRYCISYFKDIYA